MKKLYLIGGFLLILSCGNHREKIAISIFDSTRLNKDFIELIHPKLREGILELVNDSTLIQFYPEIEMKESCLVLYSMVNPELKGIYFSDTTLNITFNSDVLSFDNYKGVINVEGYNIAIFDAYNFMGNYYNMDSLQNTPYSKFKKYSLNIIETMSYYLKNGQLYYWNP
ncbi:hypothetical protein [Bacteroides sp. 519]|uniref:hypothetical protein n=1 Tax=Bacteroides sp. 519 TaxID=2302937 RepID=UPI0013D25E69|nr:hypothetical protein [Bacteroides sp. 519]NDV57678.1 hypothetical protein [Bacteroides sp. 519]